MDNISIIDTNVNVSWCLELEDGTRFFEQSNNDRTMWLPCKQHITNNNLKIRRMHLFASTNAITDDTFSGALTPEYCLGYFYMNKVIAEYGGGQVNCYAIGHVATDNLVYIRWYDSEMTLITNEIRKPEQCELGLIWNNL